MSSLIAKIRTRYEKRKSSGFRFSGVSRVKQEFAEEADINVLIARFQKTGVLTTGRISAAKPFYGDFSSGTDYQAAMEAVLRIDDEFASLPAKVRIEFENDPYQLLRFLENPANKERAIELGLIAKPSQKAPIEVRLAHDSLDSNVPVDTKSTPPAKPDTGVKGT